jgi:hypothetical protein
MVREDANRWRNCIHEAGHFVALKLAAPGLPEVREIWVGGDRGVHPHVLFEELDRFRWGRLVKDCSAALDLAVAMLAGPAASMVILGESYDDYEPGENSDQMKAVRLLDDHVWTTNADLEAQLNGSILDGLITSAAVNTREFVDEHRDVIEAVASRLFHGGSLDTDELQEAERNDPTFLLVDLIQALRHGDAGA